MNFLERFTVYQLKAEKNKALKENEKLKKENEDLKKELIELQEYHLVILEENKRNYEKVLLLKKENLELMEKLEGKEE